MKRRHKNSIYFLRMSEQSMGPDSNNRRIMSQMNERQQKSVNEVYNAMMPRQDETLQSIFNCFFVILWSNSPKFI